METKINSDNVEEILTRLQVLLTTMKNVYKELPEKFRKEIKNNYPNSNPLNNIYELEKDIDYWIRNYESVIDELEEN